MIKCNVKNVNNFCENNFKNPINSENIKNNIEYVQSFMPKYEDLKIVTCPCCGAKNALCKHGTYNRNISFVTDKNKIINTNVSVTRVICNSCSKTHALLPDFVVPYKNYSFNTIIKIASDIAKTSVYKVSNTLDTSFQALYNLISDVLSFFFLFKLLNNAHSEFNETEFTKTFYLNNLSDCIFKLTEYKFFKMHNWYIFMTKFRNNPDPQPRISLNMYR